jgi:CheY-like chemotaxis protein
MEIICGHCQEKYRIPDEKLRPGMLLSINCPHCKNKIPIDTRNPVPLESVFSATAEMYTPSEEPPSEPYDMSPEFSEPGIMTALICSSDTEIRSITSRDLAAKSFSPSEASTGLIAQRKMRFQTFDVVVIDESFNAPRTDAALVLEVLAEIPISTRRNQFVILLSDRHQTHDNLTAFRHSVNMVIHKKNIQEFGRLLSSGLADHKTFYRVFRESLTRTGRSS